MMKIVQTLPRIVFRREFVFLLIVNIAVSQTFAQDRTIPGKVITPHPDLPV